MKNLTVTALIPTFNAIKLLKKNLPAVLKILRNQDELLIVDDASQDDSLDFLVKKFHCQKIAFCNQQVTNLRINNYKNHWGEIYRGCFIDENKKKKILVKILKNYQNERFAVSCNRGVEIAAGDLILLLNNDVEPSPNLLSYLLPYFQTLDLKYQPDDKIKTNFNTEVFAVGCLEYENRNKKKGGKNQLWFDKGRFMHSRADDFQSGESAWASGGSAIFDRRKWLKLNGFDKRYYPAYWEDVDLSFRAKKKGWLVLFEEKALVYHHHESTNREVFGQEKMQKISWRNSNKFVWKNGTIWQKISFLMWLPYWYWQKAKK